MASLLVVENPKTGEQVAVPAAHYRRNLEPEGWRALAYEDGSDYEPPAPKDAKGAGKADEQKAEG